eukprot:gene5753-biopygen4667
MKIHSAAIEKNLSEKLEVVTARLDTIHKKMEKIETIQVSANNKINSLDANIDNIWKENAAIKKEHEELLKKLKESQSKAEIAQKKTDDLEQYGRKTMLEINGFPRSAEEDPLSNANWYYYNPGFFASQSENNDNSADRNINVLNEDFFNCNVDKSCSVLSKVKGTNGKEIWNKVQGPPLYVIPKDNGTALGNNWPEARQYCFDLKGDLVSIRDSAENERIAEFIKSTGMGRSIWIGLNDRRQEGTMEWSNGSPVTFTNWNTGEPNSASEDEDCAALLSYRNGFPWNDAWCSTNINPFICEIPSN